MVASRRSPRPFSLTSLRLLLPLLTLVYFGLNLRVFVSGNFLLLTSSNSVGTYAEWKVNFLANSSSLKTTGCFFGPCIHLNESVCATLYPLRLQNEWDESTRSLYQAHKRTMHFEVINLIHKDARWNRTISDFPKVSRQELTACRNNDTSLYPDLITYFHIFKNGGTTIRNAFWNPLPATSPYQNPKILFTGIQNRVGSQKFHNRLNTTTRRIHAGQQIQQQHLQATDFSSLSTFSPYQQVATFTFLREPTSRFLSGLGQVLHKHTLRKLAPTFGLMPCLDLPSSTILLDCVLSRMLSQQRFFDFHLLPQAFLLRDFTGELDIGIMLLDISMIPNVLERIHGGLAPSQVHSKQARQSRLANYTGGHDFTVDILTPGQRRIICSLYRVDFDMINQWTRAIGRSYNYNDCLF